ncbi:MAG: hypothetical protein AB8B58_15440 [Roseobacter sp.]
MVVEYQSAIRAAQRHLEGARTVITADISENPTPIASCDAQFNHLLAERQKVLEALRTLQTDVFVPTPRTPTEFAGVESR